MAVGVGGGGGVGVGGGEIENTNFQLWIKYTSFNEGQDILCGILTDTFEIPHKIFYPYIERHIFYATFKF